MSWLIALLVALAGYFLGSISFARLIVRVFSPDEDISEVEVQLSASDTAFRSSVVSATTVNLQLGPRYGCLTSLLDMLKVAVPTLALKLWRPDTSYYLILAAMGTLGHNWPAFHGFRGGRGMSTILGGMVVVDWIGILLTTSVSFLVGTLLRSFYFANRLSILLMIPWLWLRHEDLSLVAYAIAVNVMNGIAIIPEAREMLRLRRDGALEEFLTAERVRVAGDGSNHDEERLTFYGTLLSLFNPARDEAADPADSGEGASCASGDDLQ